VHNYAGDNGGPTYWTDLGPVYAHGGSANNFPLKGGKSSPLEGGVRVAAFASGGLIPLTMRGKTLGEPQHAIHVCDWYHTFASLAGVDYLDAPPGLPDNTDSLDVWPMLSGKSLTSPRKEVPIAIEGNSGGGHSATGQYAANNITALIVGDYKVIFGYLVASAYWQGPDFPNASYTAWMASLGGAWWTNSSQNCGSIDTKGDGCLFNIKEDETEHVDLSKTQPAKLEELRARVIELRRTLFNPDRCAPYSSVGGCAEAKALWVAAIGKNGGYFAPFLD
jgi:arylsulfatase B